MNKKRKNVNKKNINKIINISVLIFTICLFTAFLYRKNITSYINEKKLLKTVYETLEDKNNIYLLEKKYKQNNGNNSFYLLLNVSNKEIITINLNENNKAIINKSNLIKIPKIANNDLIKLDLNSSSKNNLFSYYINMNIKNNILYFCFLDGSMYKTDKNIILPDNIIKDILNSAEFIKIMELEKNKENLDILYSEIHKKIILATKNNNNYIDLNYLDPYISKNNYYNENNIINLLKEYKDNFNPNISLNILNNKIYNTRNAYSKFVTIINTDKEQILNIRPAGSLYNIMFEFNINEKDIIK